MSATVPCFVRICRPVIEYVRVSAVTLDEAREIVKNALPDCQVVGATYEEEDYELIPENNEINLQ